MIFVSHSCCDISIVKTLAHVLFCRMEVLPSKDALRETKRYMAYITTDKIGLIILPLDGNPHNAMALIAHPSGVSKHHG